MRNSETHWNGGIPWNCTVPKQSCPNQGIWARGISRCSWGRSGATSQAEDVQGLRGMGGGDYKRPQGHEPTKPFEGVSSAPSTTRLYRRAHHPPPVGSRLAGNVESSNPKKMQGMRSSSEYNGMHGNVGFVEILGTAKHVEFLRNTSALRGKRLTCCIRSNTSELQGHVRIVEFTVPDNCLGIGSLWYQLGGCFPCQA